MRSIKKSFLFLLAAAAVSVVAPNETEAQTFPTSEWTPLARTTPAVTGTTAIINALAVGGSDDIVGDTSAAGAAAYVHSDDSYLYMRIRLNADPAPGGVIRNDRLFGCEMPYFSPGGKPVLITYGLKELDERFER